MLKLKSHLPTAPTGTVALMLQCCVRLLLLSSSCVVC